MKLYRDFAGLFITATLLLIAGPVSALDCLDFVETEIAAQELQIGSADEIVVQPTWTQMRWWRGDTYTQLIFHFDSATGAIRQATFSKYVAQCVSGGVAGCFEYSEIFQIQYGGYVYAVRDIWNSIIHRYERYEICRADL